MPPKINTFQKRIENKQIISSSIIYYIAKKEESKWRREKFPQQEEERHSAPLLVGIMMDYTEFKDKERTDFDEVSSLFFAPLYGHNYGLK